jgi:ribosomal protein L12E/L44/L45/RPP1/RPP2
VQQELGGTLEVDSDEGATKATAGTPRRTPGEPNTQPAGVVHEQQQQQQQQQQQEEEEEEEEEVRGIVVRTLF